MLGVDDVPDRTTPATGDARGRRRRWASGTRSGRRRSACSSAPPGASRSTDPYFGGAGPARTGCIDCGVVHDRLPAQRQEHPAEELPWLAEQAGAEVHPLTTVTAVRAAARAAGTPSTPRATGRRGRRRRQRLHRRPGGLRGRALGTQRLLHRMRDDAARCRGCRRPARRAAPAPTPSRSSGAIAPRDGRRLQPRRRDHVVVPPGRATPTSSRCATGQGCNLMGLLQTVLTDGGGGRARWRSLAAARCGAQRRHAAATCRLRRWSERTVIALVMQSLDNSLTTFTEPARLHRAVAADARGRATARRTRPGSRPATTPCGGWPTVDRRHRGRQRGRAVQRPDDRALHRRLRDRRRRRDGVVDAYHRVSATRACTSWTARPSRRTSA